MRVEVRLFATLASYLPSGSRGGATVLEIPQECTVADLVTRLGIPPALPRIALVNGHEADPDRRLATGDVVTLFPPLAGG